MVFPKGESDFTRLLNISDHQNSSSTPSCLSRVSPSPYHFLSFLWENISIGSWGQGSWPKMDHYLTWIIPLNVTQPDRENRETERKTSVNVMTLHFWLLAVVFLLYAAESKLHKWMHRENSPTSVYKIKILLLVLYRWRWFNDRLDYGFAGEQTQGSLFSNKMSV